MLFGFLSIIVHGMTNAEIQAVLDRMPPDAIVRIRLADPDGVAEDEPLTDGDLLDIVGTSSFIQASGTEIHILADIPED